MSFQRFLLFLTIIYQLTNFELGAANDPHLNTQFCGGIFRDDEPLDSFYHNNVQTVLSYLQGQPSFDDTPRPTFLKWSYGHGSAKAYGSYLCRGDLSDEKCLLCLGSAAKLLSQDDQIMGYDCFLYNINLECMLHYTNTSKFMAYRKDNVIGGEAYGDDLSNHPQYNMTLSRAMEEVVTEAGDGTWKKANYTTRVVKVAESNENIYILAQCTPDISAMNCSSCLSDLRNSFPPKSVGGQAIGANCLFKYNDHSFFISSTYRSVMHSNFRVFSFLLLALFITLV